LQSDSLESCAWESLDDPAWIRLLLLQLIDL
jgi:hypothetical protein